MAEIRNSKVFSAQNQVVFFWPKSEIQTFEGGLFSNGGAIFNFSQEIGLKTTKMVRFCILHKPMGGSIPPAPPLATLLYSTSFSKGPDPVDGKSLGPGKMKNKFRLKTRTKKRSSTLLETKIQLKTKKKGLHRNLRD